MSERTSSVGSSFEPVSLKTGLEALQTGAEFDGPVEDVDGHHCNDHFAQIYESDEERFAAAVPFVRHGLTHDEQVVYVVEPHREPEVRAALRDGGIDVDAAVERGQLSFYTAQETYLRNDSFEPAEMRKFYADTVAAATEDYEAMRLVAETSWLDPDDISYDRFLEYEAKVNRLFDNEDCVAICQYDRDQFSPEFIQNIVRSHPHLIYDGAACHNVYYTPPAEVFDDDPARETNRMLATLRDRAAAKADLEQRDRFLRDLHAITADQSKSFEEKIHALLDLGCEQFGLDLGALNRVDSDADRLEVEYTRGTHTHFEPGVELPLSDTYCQAAADIEDAATVSDPAAEGFDDLPVYEEFGVEGYIGTYIPVDGDMDRTLAFVPDESRAVSFSDADRMCLELMGQWLGYELNRRQRERFLRDCYEITADPDRGFEEKLHALLDRGREWFGVEAAGLTHLPDEDGEFLTEYALGYGDGGVVTAADNVWTDPGDGCYCRQAVESDAPVGKADVRSTDWADDPIHQDHGLSCYLGTQVTDGATPYGTLWVGDTDPRDRAFTETERTFLDLMARWVSYELERREHTDAQRELYEITADTGLDTDEKIARLLDLGCNHLDLPVGMLNRDCEEGIEVEQIRGTHPDVSAGAVLPPTSEHYCRQAIDTEAPVTVADAEAAGWDGDPLYEEVGLETYAGVPVIVDGEVYGTICFTDLSPRNGEFTDAERTFLELMGRCASYELDRSHRETQLEQRTTQLEDKTERLENFARMLAHELRNPVQIGQIYTGQLPADADGTDYVREAFDRIENMIDVLLVLTRGRDAVDDCESVDLATAARDAWANVDASEATLTIESDATMDADDTYIRHLFRNLLENAVVHGGPDVDVTVGTLDETDGFYVEDDGPGIPPADRDRVFDEGFTTAADNGGTGLGLAFVRELVDVYDWTIRVTESTAGGARFEFQNVEPTAEGE